jgi:serine/threonine protein kinase
VVYWSASIRAHDRPSTFLGLKTKRYNVENNKRKYVIIQVDKTKIEYPVNIPEDARSFIELLVQKDPSLRPKCKDLLRHPFIVNNTKKIKTGKKGLEY